jgi:hypothetical protein
MVITMNGERIDFSLESESTVGELLSSLDSWLKDRGLLITALSLDGRDSVGGLSSLRDAPLGGIQRVDLGVGTRASYRVSALARCAEFARRLQGAAAASAKIPATEKNLAEAGATGKKILDECRAYLNPEEISPFETALKALAAENRERLAETHIKFVALFDSRLEEAERPAASILAAAESFNAARPRICDIAVCLQTGRDREAMSAVSELAEISSTAFRLVPYVAELGHEASPSDFGGASPRDFYAGMNRVLDELLSAFSSRDTVLIGDLCEYEILPRLDLLFGTLDRAAKVGGSPCPR